MQKAKLEIFVQCLKKSLVQFLLQAACRLSCRWEENTNAAICCTHWLSTTKPVLKQVTWVQSLEQHSISTMCHAVRLITQSCFLSCLWALVLWQVAILPVPGCTACTPLEMRFMVLDTQQHVYTAQSACLGHLLPGWQNVRERLGELQWKRWEHSRKGESWKQGGAQKFCSEKDPVGNAGHTECKSGENYNSLVTLFTGCSFSIIFSSLLRKDK